MSRTWKNALALTCAGAVAVAVWVSRTEPAGVSPRPDLNPSAHWAFHPDHLDGKKLTPAVGKLTGTLLGTPKMTPGGLELSGPDDGVLIRDRVAPDAAFLPKESLSVVAWVRIDEPTEWGGVLGCLQDNGPVEHGFVVGFNKSNFYFGLASQGAKPVRITYLQGKTPYRRGKWYHVAAVYDGNRMRLFVNGELDAASAEQSGPVAYAKAAPLVVGRYRDDDEDFGMQGAIREVMLCPHAVTADQVREHFAADKALAAQPTTVPDGPRFVVEPYLQYGTRTSMTVLWETETPCTASVQYGTKLPLAQAADVGKPDTMGEVVLSKLEPKTKYFYQVIATDAEGRAAQSKVLTFQTAAEPTDAFSFTVVGDTQRNPSVTGRIAKLMWERRPNFVVHCGDVVDDGAAKWQWTRDLFRPCHELFGRVPVYPCIGNHEKNHAHYYKYFALPKPEYYYSFKYGNAEFFVLDTNTNRDLTPKGEQYAWLDKALAASDAKWKFCYHHHPPYSSDDDDFGDTWKGETTAGDVRVRHFVGLYEKHKVDVVFNGHVHVYERTWPIRGGKVDEANGVVYVTTGGGGGRLENFAPTPAFFKQEARSDYHFCYVTMHQGTFNLKAIDHEGRQFDSFTLKK